MASAARAGRELDASIEVAVDQLQQQFLNLLAMQQYDMSMVGKKAVLTVNFQLSPAAPEGSVVTKLKERFYNKISHSSRSQLKIDIAIVRPDRSSTRRSRVRVNVTVGGYLQQEQPSVLLGAPLQRSALRMQGESIERQAEIMRSQVEIRRIVMRAQAAEGGPQSPEARRVINSYRVDRMRDINKVDAAQQPIASDILRRFNVAVSEAGLAYSPLPSSPSSSARQSRSSTPLLTPLRTPSVHALSGHACALGTPDSRGSPKSHSAGDSDDNEVDKTSTAGTNPKHRWHGRPPMPLIGALPQHSYSPPLTPRWANVSGGLTQHVIS